MQGRSWGLLASAGLLCSCLSGQTGSADCAPSKASCVCEGLAGKSQVQATVVALDGTNATLEIEAVLNPNTLLGPGDVHRRVVGTLSTALPCSDAAGTTPNVGDSVFAAFFPYSDADPLPADVLVLPWAEHIDLGNGASATLSEAATLSDPESCDNAYPRDSAPPCKDTSSVGDCALSRATSAPGTPPWWLASLVIGLAARRLRRSTRTR